MTKNEYRNATEIFPSLLGQFFNTAFDAAGQGQKGYASVNLTEDDNAYTLDIAMAGVTKEMTHIELTSEGELVVKVEKKKDAEEGKKWLRHEFGVKDYEQTFSLADDIDKEDIKATVSNGIISVHLAKKAEEPRPANTAIEIN